jgi:cation diffusion facilitator family transporter
MGAEWDRWSVIDRVAARRSRFRRKRRRRYAWQAHCPRGRARRWPVPVAVQADRSPEAAARGREALGRAAAFVVIICGVELVVAIWTTKSVALLAHTLLNAADVLTIVPVWVGLTVDRRPASRRARDYDRVEDLFGIMLLGLFAAATAVLFWWAGTLLHPREMEQLRWVSFTALAGFVGVELVAWWRGRAAAATGSLSVVAGGLHGGWGWGATLIVMLGAVGQFFDVERSDALAGLLVGSLLVVALARRGRLFVSRLLGAVRPALVLRARLLASDTDGVQSVGRVRLRPAGHRLQAEVEIGVDSGLGVWEADAVAQRAGERLVQAMPLVTSAIVRARPAPAVLATGADPGNGLRASAPAAAAVAAPIFHFLP